MVAALSAARPARSSDRLVAVADAVLVVGGALGRRRAPVSIACRSISCCSSSAPSSCAAPGCTWNDITDRDLDAKVERTRSRPIPAGQVSVKQALAFLVAQALVGLAVLLQFNRFAVLTGIASLVIVAVYPFMKRITWWPQIVLGLAFSWGALMGFAVTFGRLDATAFVLYAGSIAWVIGYDTIYAHQDTEDDALIGIKSTARLFAERTHQALVMFYGLAVVLIGDRARACRRGLAAWIGLAVFAVHLGWQIRRLKIDDPALCLRLFKSNRDAGLLLFAGLLIDAVMRAA